MDNRLRDLYALTECANTEDVDLENLRWECGHLEEQVILLMDSLPLPQQLLLQDYISARDELEFQLVKRALRFGRIKESH